MIIEVEGVPLCFIGLVGFFRLRPGEDRQPVFMAEGPGDSEQKWLVWLESLGIEPGSPHLAKALSVAPLVTPERGVLSRFLCHYLFTPRRTQKP